MKRDKRKERKKTVLIVAVFLVVNLVSMAVLGVRTASVIQQKLSDHAQNTEEQFNNILLNYERSFQLFTQMMGREIETHPEPDAIWDYLKTIDAPLLEVEGETFDGLYMYYQGRYLYSWDTPYSVYENTGYKATERPWYQAALAAKGEIVFTPPYMSYANHYILTTISQLQPDGETVFAYDIKMGDIQSLVSAVNQFEKEQVMIFDGNGTVIGSTRDTYLGGSLYSTLGEASGAVEEAGSACNEAGQEELAKAEDKLEAAMSFYTFRQSFDSGFQQLKAAGEKAKVIKADGINQFGFLRHSGDYSFLILVPVSSVLKAVTNVWLVPLLIIELLLIYLLGRLIKEQKNRELKSAYVELGQIQKRLEIALSAAQKAAAVDDLTGMMNFKSFRKQVTDQLDILEDGESGILIMIDGDHFKYINDNYGHSVGDEVIKLTAQMIVGRIRTIDLASRLHGDEFAIYVADTADYAVAKGIMEDINKTLAKEAAKRNLPPITLSAGGVVAGRGDNYIALSKAADAALYKAKETHNGGFASAQQ